MNRRLFYIALLLSVASCLTQLRNNATRAQLTTTGVGGGFGAGAAGFAGPADIVASPTTWWSCTHAVSASYASGLGNACDIVRASDSATCTIQFAATGLADVSVGTPCTGATTVTAFCNATTCTVTKMYDQSGTNSCGIGVPCDMTQAVVAVQPTLTFNASGSSPGITCGGSQVMILTMTYSAPTQPYVVIFEAKRTGATGSFNDVISDNGSQFQDGFYNVSGSALMYAGSLGQVTGLTENAFHAFQAVHDDAGSGSIYYIDGGSNSVTAGTNAPAALLTICSNSPVSNALTGVFLGGGIWAGRFATGVSCGSQAACLAAMNSNMHTNGGF